MSISLGTIIGDQDDLERQPLVIRQNSATENHARFEQNQTRAAINVLRSPAFGCCTLFALLIILYFWWSYYIRGWTAWINHREKPCDQPLANWLLAMLLFPIVLWCLDQKEHGLRFLVIFLTTTVMFSGFYMFLQTETCADTNPGLYEFVKEYLIFLAIWHISWHLVTCALIASLIYGLANGWFDDVLNDAASPETIDHMETVDYDPSLFAQDGVPGDNRPAPECCICTDKFDANKRIKRTPCQHVFHKECLEDWLKRSKTCPLCRNDLEAAASQPSADVPQGAPKDQVINRGSLFNLDPGATVPPGNSPGIQL